MENTILEEMFLVETTKEDDELHLIDYEKIEEIIWEMRTNLWEKKAAQLFQRLDTKVDELIRKTWDTIKNTPIACGSVELMVAAWVLYLRDKKKPATVISLNRWYKANCHRSKEELEKLLMDKVDIHSLLDRSLPNV
jgi:hypothetical protein